MAQWTHLRPTRPTDELGEWMGVFARVRSTTKISRSSFRRKQCNEFSFDASSCIDSRRGYFSGTGQGNSVSAIVDDDDLRPVVDAVAVRYERWELLSAESKENPVESPVIDELVLIEASSP